MRVQQFLLDQNVSFETMAHPPAYTAQRRAKYLHVPGRRLAKSVLLRGPGGYLVAVLSATSQVDLDRLAQALGGPVRLADREEIPEFFRDCEWGGSSPFGSLYGLPTVLEDSLSPNAVIVFEAHSHGDSIRMRCGDFEALERPRRLSFANGPSRNTSTPTG